MYKLLKKDGRAKRGELVTVHGTVQTPVFMNVGDGGGDQRRGVHRRPAADQNTDRAVQHVSSARAPRGTG